MYGIGLTLKKNKKKTKKTKSIGYRAHVWYRSNPKDDLRLSKLFGVLWVHSWQFYMYLCVCVCGQSNCTTNMFSWRKSSRAILCFSRDKLARYQPNFVYDVYKTLCSILTYSGQYLWCCHRDIAIARMNIEWHWVAVDRKLTNYGHESGSVVMVGVKNNTSTPLLGVIPCEYCHKWYTTEN